MVKWKNYQAKFWHRTQWKPILVKVAKFWFVSLGTHVGNQPNAPEHVPPTRALEACIIVYDYYAYNIVILSWSSNKLIPKIRVSQIILSLINFI